MGGIGMSGIARFYLSQGHTIQGSDVQKSDTLMDLERLGANVFIGHNASHVQDADLVVYSSSIPASHPERMAALKRGVSIVHRSEALAELCRGKMTIAVSGTHGKTTTTAMIGMVLEEAGRDPSVAVGATIRQFGGNARLGLGPEMVIEADESDASFLNFLPDLAVVTNIEREHMDHYGSMEDVLGTFEKFIRRLPEDGLWVGCAEDQHVTALAHKRIRPNRLYGFSKSPNQYWASDIQECRGGRRGLTYTAWFGDRRLGVIELGLVGRHNILNSLAALAVAEYLNLDFEVIARGLARFEGAGRRFDLRYEGVEAWIVDDYAHHPTEIRKTLAGAKHLNRRIVALFQPHRFSRTQDLFGEFATAFGDADQVIVTDVYAASELPREGVTGLALSRAIQEAGHPAVGYIPRTSLVEEVLKQIKPGDLVMTLGAGDITRASYELADFFKKSTPQVIQAAFANIQGEVLRQEPLARHTTLKIGGPAEYWIVPEDEQDLSVVLVEAKRLSLPVFVMGAGSNILAPDEGLPGVVLSLNASKFKQIRRDGDRWWVGAGTPNSLFIAAALKGGFGGFEFLSGIPGQIGGAVAMNAGSHGQSIDSFVDLIRVIDFNGQAKELFRGQMGFGYRRSSIKDCVITEVCLTFPRVAEGVAQAKLDEYRAYRAATQDLWHASAGCLFKNPDIPGCSSGRLIDEAGLKGFRVGQAQISDKHANFLVNLGGATSRDVKAVIEEVRRRVKAQSGVDLHTEVKIL